MVTGRRAPLIGAGAALAVVTALGVTYGVNQVSIHRHAAKVIQMERQDTRNARTVIIDSGPVLHLKPGQPIPSWLPESTKVVRDG